MQHRRIGRDGAERLRRIEALRDLSLGQRRMLAEIADEVDVAAGEVLFNQDDPGYELIMLEQGSADVLQDGQLINTVGPGDFFGELAVLDGGAPRSATVVARTDLRAIVLSARFARELRERMPEVGARIDSIAAGRRERDRLSRP